MSITPFPLSESGRGRIAAHLVRACVMDTAEVREVFDGIDQLTYYAMTNVGLTVDRVEVCAPSGIVTLFSRSGRTLGMVDDHGYRHAICPDFDTGIVEPSPAPKETNP